MNNYWRLVQLYNYTTTSTITGNYWQLLQPKLLTTGTTIQLLQPVQLLAIIGNCYNYKQLLETSTTTVPSRKRAHYRMSAHPHFGLNFLLRSSVYSNMRPCDPRERGPMGSAPNTNTNIGPRFGMGRYSRYQYHI